MRAVVEEARIKDVAHDIFGNVKPEPQGAPRRVRLRGGQIVGDDEIER